MEKWLERFEKEAEEQKKERDKKRPVVDGFYKLHPPSDSTLRKKTRTPKP